MSVPGFSLVALSNILQCRLKDMVSEPRHGEVKKVSPKHH